MGKAVSKVFGRKQYRVLMVGLDAAGKTTILYRLHLEQQVSTIPTIGFNVEKVRTKNAKFTVWDVGGQQKIRPLWKHYFDNTNAVIFVIDSCDRERMEEAAKELKDLLEDEKLKNAVLLVLANKQDLDGALSATEITEALNLDKRRLGVTIV
mmetsp:Transcript_21740/g.37322  ORF Transcript_21740/g.37322 Transcript_21740/m.37322 type:complete len:152 (-) Transcript_21740:462-917(-)